MKFSRNKEVQIDDYLFVVLPLNAKRHFELCDEYKDRDENNAFMRATMTECITLDGKPAFASLDELLDLPAYVFMPLMKATSYVNTWNTEAVEDLKKS
jgi:hypothetical protein